MEPKVKEQIALIENALSKLNWKGNPQSLYDPIEYVLSLGGKRIRPAPTPSNPISVWEKFQ